MVELLLARRLARSLLEESVLRDGVKEMDGRGLQRACAWDDRCTRCDKSSELGPHRQESFEQEAHPSSCRLCVPFASLLESF